MKHTHIHTHSYIDYTHYVWAYVLQRKQIAMYVAVMT